MILFYIWAIIMSRTNKLNHQILRSVELTFEGVYCCLYLPLQLIGLGILVIVQYEIQAIVGSFWSLLSSIFCSFSSYYHHFCFIVSIEQYLIIHFAYLESIRLMPILIQLRLFFSFVFWISHQEMTQIGQDRV